MAARAVLPAREARGHRAHEPVVVQVQHDLGPGLLGRGERAPPVGRVDVVRVHDPCVRALDRLRDLVGVQPAADEPEGRILRPDRGRIALEDLDVLVQVLADQPLRSATARSSPPTWR